MTLNELAKEIHENAVAHGFWDEDRPLPEVLMLIVSELAEALEEARAGDKMNGRISCMHYYSGEGYVSSAPTNCCKKPEGIDIEGIVREKHEYNKTRPYKHGKKF